MGDIKKSVKRNDLNLEGSYISYMALDNDNIKIQLHGLNICSNDEYGE